MNQAGQNWRDSSLKGCSFPPDKTWLTKISQQWIIHILGYLEQNLKHTTDLSLLSAAAAAAKSLQSCPTLCDSRDGSPPGSPVPGILQARTPEWVAISFSNAWKWKVKVKLLSHVRLFTTPWTAAYQAPLSMGFSRQEYWSGVPLPSPSLLSSILLSKLSSLVSLYKKHECNLNYNLNLVRNYSWTSFLSLKFQGEDLYSYPPYEKRGDLSNGWVWDKELRSACLVPNLFFEKMSVPTVLWTWVCSRLPMSGMGVKHLLPPLRPAWGSIRLGMKFSEARCDCTAKARPPISRLSSTKTQHSRSAVEETLGCSSMMARSQMRKQDEIAFNKGYFSLHHPHHENTIKTTNPCALTEMDILTTMITQWKLVAI